MNKTLHNMPKAIYGSALAARDTWYSRPITRCAEWLDYASLLTSAISKWVVGLWWLLGTIPPLADTFANSRGYILIFFIHTFFHILLHLNKHVHTLIPVITSRLHLRRRRCHECADGASHAGAGRDCLAVSDGA